MRIYETHKLQRLRKKLRSDNEKQALKQTIAFVAANPLAGKKLKGNFKEFRNYSYSMSGQERRHIYQGEGATLYLLSFGPRKGIIVNFQRA